MKDKEIFYKTNLIGVLNTKVLNYLEFNKILAKFIGVPHTTLQLEENLYIQANQSLFGYSIKTFSCIDNIKKPPFGSKKLLEHIGPKSVIPELSNQVVYQCVECMSENVPENLWLSLGYVKIYSRINTAGHFYYNEETNMQVSAYRVRKNKKITEKIDDDDNFLFVYEFRCYESKINDIKEIVLKLMTLFEKFLIFGQEIDEYLHFRESDNQ